MNKKKQQSDTFSARKKIGFPAKRKDWKQAPVVYDKNKLQIFGQPVMQSWETPYMKELARIVTFQGGVILEVGFGLGISAGFIDQADIDKHIIIEANHEVARKAEQFAKKAKHPTEVIDGLWEEVINQIPDNSLEGILCDVYPLVPEEIHQDNIRFFKPAFKKLKTGGVFTYYSDEVKDFSPEHMKKLIAAGFHQRNISTIIVPVKPPKDCDYWQADSYMAPVVIK